MSSGADIPAGEMMFIHRPLGNGLVLHDRVRVDSEEGRQAIANGPSLLFTIIDTLRAKQELAYFSYPGPELDKQLADIDAKSDAIIAGIMERDKATD
jgi:hypothetical protein